MLRKKMFSFIIILFSIFIQMDWEQVLATY